MAKLTLSQKLKTAMFLLISSNFLSLSAQLLSLYDAVLNPALRVERLSQQGWVPKTNIAYYVNNAIQENKVVFYNAKLNITDTSFSFKIFDSICTTKNIKLTNLPFLTFISEFVFHFKYKSTLYSFDLKSNAIQKVISFLPSEAEAYHQKSNNLAYVVDANIFLKIGDTTPLQLSNDGGNGIVYGQAVHRSEFGINSGLFWSELGNKLAFYRMDETMVTTYPVYNLKDTPATVRLIRYPVAGAKSHHVSVGVFDIKTKKTTYLKTTGNPEDYLTNITWSPNEAFIYLARINRLQNYMSLEQYDAENGNLIKIIFNETSLTYVEPENGIIFKQGEQEVFYWQSERSGYNHLYLYQKGVFKKQITSGEFTITDFIGQNAKKLFFMSTSAHDLEQNLYSSGTNGEGPTRITKTEGTHQVIANDDFTYFIDIYSNYSMPNVYSIIDANGNERKRLLTSKNPLKNFKLGKTLVFALDNNGTKLYSRIILPSNFDSTKKYPVITYVYGGPHLQLIGNKFLAGSNYWMQYMAQKGYIVFTLDNRGSMNRGQGFESQIHRSVGDAELEDQMIGVNYLKSLSYVDTSRMGVHGWSFGGFMTTSLMTKFPNAYTVGVAGGPVIDWKFYEIMYTERYMDMPQENKAGYDKSNLLNYVKNLSGRLLMIHGTDDDVVLWQHSLLYLKACIDANNLNLDYFVYPGHPHNVLGKDRLHLMGKITQYFEDHL